MDRATAAKIRQLRAAMRANGWNEIDLAREAEVNIRMIRRYLGMYDEEPVEVGPKNAPKLARVLGLSVETVLYGPSKAA